MKFADAHPQEVGCAAYLHMFYEYRSLTMNAAPDGKVDAPN